MRSWPVVTQGRVVVSSDAGGEWVGRGSPTEAGRRGSLSERRQAGSVGSVFAARRYARRSTSSAVHEVAEKAATETPFAIPFAKDPVRFTVACDRRL